MVTRRYALVFDGFEGCAALIRCALSLSLSLHRTSLLCNESRSAPVIPVDEERFLAHLHCTAGGFVRCMCRSE